MSTTLNTRIDAKSKEQARKILDCLGLTISEAITMYFRQIILRRGIPFNIEIPNELNQDAARFKEGSRSAQGQKVDELFRELNR